MLWFKNEFTTVRAELLKSVKNNEGFEKYPYIDVLVDKAPEQHGIPPDDLKVIKKHLSKLKLTFGMGLTYITEEEALKVTEMRLKAIKTQIVNEYPHVRNENVLEVLTEMAYQMGMTGLKGFKKMHKAIKDEDYYEAKKHGLDSKWFRQTPKRAARLMNKLSES